MKINLLDGAIPLQTRYDDFLGWLDEQNNHNVDYLASLLGVTRGTIDTYFQLHDLDSNEFEIIDQNEIDLDTVYIIVHFKKVIREKIYLKIKEFLALRQTLSAIRAYVYNEIIAEYESKIQLISGDFWMGISTYLKARNIDVSPLTKNFRNMVYTAGSSKRNSKSLSSGQLEWIIQGVVFDHDSSLGVFLNDGNRTNYPNDCKLITEAIELIKGIL